MATDGKVFAATETVAVLGLGSMGLGIATSVVRTGRDVIGYDPQPRSRDAFEAAGGRIAASPAEAVEAAQVVVSVVVNANQTEALLFGEGQVAASMPAGSLFISCATMDPETVRRLAAKLEAEGLHYLDAPMSGGPARAAKGDLTVMASGSPTAFGKGRAVLDAIAGKVYELGDTPGTGAAFKMINQLLAGVHIAAACEAIAFAARQGLDLRAVYDVISVSAGNSWMFGDRIPHVLDGDYTPRSAVDIFVKDLGIVQDMARGARFPVPVSAAALQMFLAASGAGMGAEDDASLARVYAGLCGISLPAGAAVPSSEPSA